MFISKQPAKRRLPGKSTTPTRTPYRVPPTSYSDYTPSSDSCYTPASFAGNPRGGGSWALCIFVLLVLAGGIGTLVLIMI